jgi:hypothetical protein
MNIYQKLVEVRKSVPYLKKEAQGAQYQYTGSSQVLASVRVKMDELNLLLIPAITDKELQSSAIEFLNADGHVTKRTTTYFTELKMTMTWINADKPDEQIVVPWYAQGVDIAGEKGVGKALTYGEKYFMLKTFNIATDKDDPDAFQDKAQAYTKPDPISSEEVGTLKTNILEFAKLRNKTADDVYKALNITDLSKMSTRDAKIALVTVNKWIKSAKENIEKGKQQGA